MSLLTAPWNSEHSPLSTRRVFTPARSTDTLNASAHLVRRWSAPEPWSAIPCWRLPHPEAGTGTLTLVVPMVLVVCRWRSPWS